LSCIVLFCPKNCFFKLIRLAFLLSLFSQAKKQEELQNNSDNNKYYRYYSTAFLINFSKKHSLSPAFMRNE